MNKSVSVKVYHGYGHTHNLVVYGHVFKFKAKTMQGFSNNLFVNFVHLLKLFVLKPYPHVQVRLTFNGQEVYRKTEYDGFFKFEWSANKDVSAGWHGVKIEAIGKDGKVMATGLGQVFVPHITQFAFISDIDDTVMVSHSATIRRRLRELFIKNPRTRKTFKGTYAHYSALALSHTTVDQPNPFFYVSSSEWNLYDYLLEIFSYNRLPDGAFLLNQIKQLKDLLKTGKSGHEGKLMRVITLIGASIGLMNIMLVSVTERTREIGIRKAIGANPSVIRKQFLIEAVIICLIGGAFGIFLGIAIGNLISFSMGGSFIIPWDWIMGGFVLCVGVGIISGYYPAKKASKLDPVEALRYE